MKTCPECAEDVQDAAKVCRFCGHRFDQQYRDSVRAVHQEKQRNKAKNKRTVAVLIGVAVIGVWAVSDPSPKTDRDNAPVAETKAEPSTDKARGSSILYDLMNGDDTAAAPAPAPTPKPTPVPDWAKAAITEFENEPKINEVLFQNGTRSLWVSMADDGTPRDGYAEYLCISLYNLGMPRGHGVNIHIWDMASMARGEMKEIGNMYCDLKEG